MLFYFLTSIALKKRPYQVPGVLTAVDDCSPQFAQCGNVQARHIVMSLPSFFSPVRLNSARSFSCRLFKRESKKGGKEKDDRPFRLLYSLFAFSCMLFRNQIKSSSLFMSVLSDRRHSHLVRLSNERKA